MGEGVGGLAVVGAVVLVGGVGACLAAAAWRRLEPLIADRVARLIYGPGRGTGASARSRPTAPVRAPRKTDCLSSAERTSPAGVSPVGGGGIDDATFAAHVGEAYRAIVDTQVESHRQLAAALRGDWRGVRDARLRYAVAARAALDAARRAGVEVEECKAR